MEASRRAARIQRILSGRESLDDYIKGMDPAFKIPEWSRNVVLPILQRARYEPQRVCISAPPRHAKTYPILHGIAQYTRDFQNDTSAYTSYDDEKAEGKSKIIRALVRHSGVELHPARNKLSEWRTLKGGGLIAGGLNGSGLTGEGIQGIMVVDDPFPNMTSAESVRRRQTVWDNFNSVVMTRLEGASVVVIQCMTGDTPVLMADGAERLLRDIRKGDEVATYDNGQVSTSKVLNWTNNGPDKVFEIRMKSGTVVKANARHPFLVEENGETKWQRTATLKPGSVILKVTGVNGKASPASRMDATSQQSAKVDAIHTTAKRDGQTATEPPRSTRKISAKDIFDIVTELTLRNTTGSWMSRAGFALSASNLLRNQTPGLTGMGNCALTIATTVAKFAASFATTATLRSDTGRPRKSCSQPLSTCEIVRDEVLEVVEVGVEDVFDVQIERTENFIANGLVSHNTRWHSDDLIGRLIKRGGWDVINIPAVAEAGDPLGRKPGEPLDPVRYPINRSDSRRSLAALSEIEIQLGPYTWSALYQGQPRSKGDKVFGAPHYFDFDKFRIDGKRIVIGADPAASESTSADYSAAVVMAVEGKEPNAKYYVLDVWRGQVQVPDFVNVLYALQTKYWGAHIAVEAVAGFKGVAQTLQRLNRHLKIYEMRPRENKFLRAQPVAAAWNAGRVMLPMAGPDAVPLEWIGDYYEELDAFTGVADAHDDQVDATAHGFNIFEIVDSDTTDRGSYASP